MRSDDDTRSVEQEVAAGQSESTPVTLITSVVGVVVVLFLLALGARRAGLLPRLTRGARDERRAETGSSVVPLALALAGAHMRD